MSLFSGKRPSDLGVTGGRLRDCPSSPNCVCSDESRESHHVAALVLTSEPGPAWLAIRDAVSELERTRVITDTGEYLHAECTSALMGFVDDLELHLRPAEGVVAVRSASRVGHSDLDVNRKRVEALRSQLASRGVVQAGGTNVR